MSRSHKEALEKSIQAAKNNLTSKKQEAIKASLKRAGLLTSSGRVKKINVN